MRFSSLTRNCFILLLAFGALARAEDAAQPEVTLTPLEGRVRVEIGGQLFTEYVYENTPKPFLYPVMGPGETALTRNYPMKKDVEGEATDHPHHRSLWYCHGAVNGIDFWAETPKSGRIVQEKLERATSGRGRGELRTRDRWVGPDGKTVLTDRRTTTFMSAPGGGRIIDLTITLVASEGDVTFGDTKEGSMAIRTHDALSLEPKRGPAAQAVNSEGVRGSAIWGKHAKWVDYWGRLGERTVGVAIFDHPSNPRHPTTWHARAYGLIAINPFGLHDFEGKPKGAGDLQLRKGAEVTFRYRFYFHEGDPRQAKVPEIFEQFAAAKE